MSFGGQKDQDSTIIALPEKVLGVFRHVLALKRRTIRFKTLYLDKRFLDTLH